MAPCTAFSWRSGSIRPAERAGKPVDWLHSFRRMPGDPNFIRVLKNTVIISLYNQVFGFTFHVFLALSSTNPARCASDLP